MTEFYLLCWTDDTANRSSITLFDNLEEAIDTCVKECLEWDRADDMTESEIRNELKEHGICPMQSKRSNSFYYYSIKPIKLKETVNPS
jgi:hypothetical protein